MIRKERTECQECGKVYDIFWDEEDHGICIPCCKKIEAQMRADEYKLMEGFIDYEYP